MNNSKNVRNGLLILVMKPIDSLQLLVVKGEWKP